MDAPDAPVTIPAIQRMKRDGRKIVGVVAWDYLGIGPKSWIEPGWILFRLGTPWALIYGGSRIRSKSRWRSCWWSAKPCAGG